MSVQRYNIELQSDIVPSPVGEWVKASSVEKLSTALADMIDMYETKRRNGVRLGKARAALNLHGITPIQPESE